jgi:hypothetical protein
LKTFKQPLECFLKVLSCISASTTQQHRQQTFSYTKLLIGTYKFPLGVRCLSFSYPLVSLSCYRRSGKQDREGPRIQKSLKTAFKRSTGSTFALRVAYLPLLLEPESLCLAFQLLFWSTSLCTGTTPGYQQPTPGGEKEDHH